MLTAVRAQRILTMADHCPARQTPCESDHLPSFPVSGTPARAVRTTTATSPGCHAAPVPAMLHDGVVVARDDCDGRGSRIEAVLPYTEFRARYALTAQDLGPVTLLPGLINCHTHLELSHLGGMAVFGHGFERWIGSLLSHMNTPAQPAVLDAALNAAFKQMTACGTAHAADVTGRAPAAVYRAACRHDVEVDLQMEVFGYDFLQSSTPEHIWDMVWSWSDALPADGTHSDSAHATAPDTADGLHGAGTARDAFFLSAAARKRHGLLAGHSLYSTRADALVLAKQWCRSHERHFSLHLAEHPGEEELLVHGTGLLRDMLGHRVLPPDFHAPGLRPVPYATELGLLDEHTLAVHCVQCTGSDIALLCESGASVCLCPRSNALIGVGQAPVPAFLEAGLPLCLGTDSLASNHDLSLWNEARALRDTHMISPDILLRMLTIGGAHALGIADRLGTLEPGKLFRYAVLPDDFSF